MSGLLLASLSLGCFANAAPQIDEYKSRWADIKYQAPQEQKIAAMDDLIKRGEYLLKQYKDSAELSLWQGTALSSYASMKGGMSALSAAKKAKKLLEHSLSVDPKADNGQAHVILGALYAKIPGKPLGFGDKNKALYHLQAALKMDPQNLDAYYFYGDFLSAQGDKAAAKEIYEKGLRIARNTSSKLADDGRRKEIEQAIHLIS